MNTKKIISSLLIISIMATCMIFTSCEHKHSFGEVNISEPTCLAEGFYYHLCESCGYLECTETIEPLGHVFTVWEEDIRNMRRVSKCDRCGALTESSDYEEPENIPRLYVYGIPSGSEVHVKCNYNTTIGSEFSGIIKIDENIPNSSQKQSYDLFLYADSENQTPMQFMFSEKIGSHYSYSLKHEYIDKTSIRNLAASELWYETIKSRKNIPEQLKALPFLGADAGFPILFYVNDNYNGLYNICLPNDNTLFGIDSENSYLIYTHKMNGALNFGYPSNAESDLIPSTVLYPQNEQGALNAKNKFLEIFDFANSSSVEEFRKNIGNYVDIDAAIDYLLCIYLFGADNNLENFCYWVSYDGNKFIPSLYNLAVSFGIESTGYAKPAKKTLAPNYNYGVLSSGSTNVFWNKLCTAFEDEIFERYADLRNNVLTEDKIERVFHKYITLIDDEIYKSEYEEFPDKNLMNCPTTASQIRAWYADKCKVLDKILLK